MAKTIKKHHRVRPATNKLSYEELRIRSQGVGQEAQKARLILLRKNKKSR